MIIAIIKEGRGVFRGELLGLSPPPPDQWNLLISGGFHAHTGAEPPPWTNSWIRPWRKVISQIFSTCWYGYWKIYLELLNTAHLSVLRLKKYFFNSFQKSCLLIIYSINFHEIFTCVSRRIIWYPSYKV